MLHRFGAFSRSRSGPRITPSRRGYLARWMLTLGVHIGQPFGLRRFVHAVR
ncbi:MAG: hypothetical protein ACOY5H_10200 [Pseudomonadota bacterium]